MKRAKVARKAREWLGRYLPAEIIGTCTALSGAWIAYSLTGSYVIAAVAGTIGENIGYYGYFTVRETTRHYENHRHHSPLRRIVLVAVKTLRDMLIEFGPAEVLDSFLLRPFFMYIMPQIISNFGLGILAGKLCADVIFYTFAIVGYEFKKRWIETPAKPDKKETVRQTPYLEVNLPQISKAYREFKKSMPKVRIYYAMKCNPHEAVLRHLSSLGSSFEIASASELDQLIAIGVNPHEVLYSNPVKPISHIARAHEAGVWRFAFDSNMELDKIAETAPGAAVYVRIAAPRYDSTVPSEGKFGTDSTRVLDLLLYARALGLKPYGIAFHVGSQMQRLEPWEFAIKESGRLMKRLLKHDIKLQMLDIGGGFPAYYSEKTPKIAAYGASITQALQKHLPYKLEIASEPGRYLVAESGTLVATIIGIAERFGKHWLHIDVGAFNGLMEALETQNALRFPLSDSKQSQEKALYHVTGPTCDSQDTLLYDVTLSKHLAIHDQIYIHSAGAYTVAYASTFNGFPIPESFIVE